MIRKIISLLFIFQFFFLANSIANSNSISRSDFKLTSFNEFKITVELNIFEQFNINKEVTDEFAIPSEPINSLYIENFKSVSDAKTLESNSLIATYQKLLDTNPKHIFHIYQAAKSRARELEGSLTLNLITEIEFILIEQLGKTNGIQVAPDTISKRTIVQLNSVYQTISADLKEDAEVATEKFNELTGYELSTKQFSLVTGGLAAIGLYYLSDEDDSGCKDPNLNLSVDTSQVSEASGSATITATLDSVLPTNLTIPLTVSGTANSGFDYVTVNSITISAGTLTGTTAFISNDDIQYESSTDEIATFTIANIIGVCVGENNSVTIAIIENDSAPSTQLSSSISSIAENAGTSITLTATLSNPTYEAVTVALTPTGTATQGTDYSTIDDITIAAGSTLGTTSFTPTDDNMYETITAETAIVAITGVAGGGATESGTQSITLSIAADSDAAPTVTLTSSSSSVGEADSDLTLTATLSNPTHETVTISIDGTSGSATEGNDFATIADITIASGDTTGTATFNPTEDNLYDASSAESAVIAISEVSGGSATESGTQTATISITDGDSAPTVTIASSASSVGEGESALTLTATLSVATYANVVVTIDGTGGTGIEGSDFEAVSDITISAGSTSGTTAFTPTDDSGTYEDTETAVIAISGVSGGSASESGTQTATVSITENESAPTVTLASSASSVSEDGSNLTLTATLSISTYEAVTVTLDPTGTGIEGADYAAISNITISAGATTGTAVFNPTDDDKYESSTDETAIVSITGVSGGNASESGTQTASIAITENDSAPTVTLATSGTTLGENSSDVLTITATLNRATYETVTIALTPTGSATEGSDYGTIADITIAEDATTGTATFSSIDDCTIEGTTNETANVAITEVSGGGALESGTQSVALAIDDDEDAPQVTLAASATSITEGAGSITLTASIGLCTYTQDILVSIDTGGTATEGSDFALVSDITISAGNTSGTTSLTPVADNLYDAASNETAVISISNVSGGSASESGNQSVSVTLIESEIAPTVTLTSSKDNATEDGDNLTLTGTLSVATYADVIVALSASGTATDDTDYALSDTITISAGTTSGTGIFNPTPDNLYDAASSETATIDISNVSGGLASESSTQQVSITLTDNDSAPTITLNSNASAVAENGSNLTITATSSIASYENIEVDISTSGGSYSYVAVEGTDYTTISNIIISAGSIDGTTAFTPTDDNIYDASGNETTIVSINSVSGGGASISGTQSIDITIDDNEGQPFTYLTASASSIDEGGNGSVTLTASLKDINGNAIGTYEDVSVIISTSGTATEEVDYAEVANFSISAGNTSGTGTFTPTDDCTYETDNEIATIQIGNLSGGSAQSANNPNERTSITITDDEGTPVVSLSSSLSSITEGAGSVTLTASIGLCPYNEDITVALDGTGGTATEGTDFNTVSDITISTGDTTGTVSLTPVADSLYDAAISETAIISISSVSGGTASESGTQSETITIVDSNGVPGTYLSVDHDTVGEDAAGNPNIKAHLTHKSYADVTVALLTSGTATEGTDFATVSDITISAGSLNNTTAFDPTPDDHYDALSAETATISIGSVSGGGSVGSSNQSVSISITDAESAPRVSMDEGQLMTDETSRGGLIYADLSGKTFEDVIVVIDGTTGTATEGVDFQTVSNITISAGSLRGTVAFLPIDDETRDDNDAGTSYETARMLISSLSGGGATINGADMVAITKIGDDDNEPTVQLTSSADAIDEDSTSTIVLTATLANKTFEDVVVALGTNSGSGIATEGTDFANIADITISAGTLYGTAVFDPTNDCIIESGNETSTITMTGFTGGEAEAHSSNQSKQLTITDDEGAPSITLVSSASTVAESGSDLTLTAAITGSCTASADITVALDGTGGTATEGTDFATVSDITITAGQPSGTTTFNPTVDSLYDAASAETAIIDISGVDGSNAEESGTQQVSISITDAESAPTVTLETSASSVGEDDSDLTLTAKLSNKTYQDVTIAIDGTGGTATEGTDFAEVSNITISAGTTEKTTAFNPTPDDVYDAASAETGVIAISSVSGGSASVSGTQSVSISITDAESAPTVTLETSASSVGEDDSDLTLTAKLSNKTYQDVTIAIDGTGGTATEGTDFAEVSNITISAGTTEKTTAFNPTPDDVYDAASAETGVIAISSVSGGSASVSGTQSVSISITDAESAPTVQLTSNADAIDEDSTSTLTLTATLSGKTFEDVVVALGTNSGSGIATEGTDFAEVSNITISAGTLDGTAVFDPTNDCVIESGNETSTITMTGFTGGGVLAHSSNQSKQLTITDDEGAPSITLVSSASTVAESGSDLTLTAAISGSCTANADITVALDGTGGSATEGTDFATVSDITITAGQPSGTTTFNPTVDSLYDAASAETAIIDISGVDGSNAEESGTQQVSISITESNSAPTVTLSTNDDSLSESDADAELKATLSLATYQDVTVTLNTNGTATEGTDFAEVSNITISAGATEGTTAFNPTDDSHYDAASAESATIYIEDVQGGAATESGEQTLAIAITDNESAPTVTLEASDTTVYDSGSDLTLKAILSGTTYEATVVDLAGTGATEGTDYATLSNITISAGATEGTTAFNPTPTLTYEATETATVVINEVTGGGGALESGNQSVSISITQHFLNIGTTFTDYSATTVSGQSYNWETAFKNLSSYTNINVSNYSNDPHAFEHSNIAKAWSFWNGSKFLDGTGQEIAIIDGNFNSSVDDLKNKTITTYGSLSNATSSNSHGNNVSGIAAADCSSGWFRGVACNADLWWADISALSSLDAITTAAKSAGTIVQNNSWGRSRGWFCDINDITKAHCNFMGYSAQGQDQMWVATDVAILKNYFTNTLGQTYADTDHEVLAIMLGQTSSSSDASTNESDLTNYVNALDSYQDNGVVVFVTCNFSSNLGVGYVNENDACLPGALPVFYTQLQEAWISVGMININASGTVTRYGNICGSTAAYCLVADGINLGIVDHDNFDVLNGNAIDTGNSGSSYAAPQISGMIALLAEAFPNHTPAQLTDRLLASANNSFFSVTAYTNFANGTRHGYDTTYGHGIPDIYGALSPINTGTYSVSQMLTGGTILSSRSQSDGGAYGINSSQFIQSQSLGDSLSAALQGTSAYFYDGLDGGFKFNFSNLFSLNNANLSLLSTLSSDISRLKHFNKLETKKYNYSFSNILGSIGSKDSNLLSINIDTPSKPIQYFNQLNTGQDFYLTSFNNPFTDNKKGGLGISNEFKVGDKDILIGYHDTEQRSGLFGETEFKAKTLAMTVSQSNELFDNFTLLSGLMIEQDTLLDSKGSGALGFHDTNPHSLFAGVNLEKVIGDDLSIKFVSTIGYSTVDTPSNSLIGEVTDITSVSFNFIANKYNIFNDNDRLAISIGQPNRVESGSMVVRLPGLAAATGEIPYENVIVDLTPSGRQIDIGIDYVVELDNDLILGFKNTISKDFNHINDAQLNNTFTFTATLDF